MSETWIKVKGNDNYSVSSMGRLRRDAGGRGARAGKMLRTSPNGQGYPHVRLFSDGASTKVAVHKLVAIAFLDSINVVYGCHKGEIQINHKDGNRMNNIPSNLEWATHSENAAHAYATGLVDLRLRRGENNYQAKLSEEDVRFIRLTSKSSRVLAKELGVSRSTIRDALKGRSWRHA